MKKINYYIKENSVLAKIAAKKMASQRMAMVLVKTIHLHNVTEVDFLQNKPWLQHELCHIRQFNQHGLYRFLLLYLWETMRKGYVNNKFEVAARQVESDL